MCERERTSVVREIECEQGELSRETGGSNEKVSEGNNELRKKRESDNK